VSEEEFPQEEEEKLNEDYMDDDDDSGSDSGEAEPDVPDDYVLNEPIRVRPFHRSSSLYQRLI
jgi:hypothetical protein